MDEERHGAGAELLDEEVGEEVVVLGEVAHMHDLCWTPFEGGGGGRDAGGGGETGHGSDGLGTGVMRGALWWRKERACCALATTAPILSGKTPRT